MKVKRWYPRLMKRADQLPRKPFIGAMGICRECFGVTEVLKPCCEGDVEYNGIIFRVEDIEQEPAGV